MTSKETDTTSDVEDPDLLLRKGSPDQNETDPQHWMQQTAA